MGWLRLFVVVLFGFVGATAIRAEEEDVFVRLYKARLQQSEAVLAQDQAEASYRYATYKRLEKLLDSNAASRQEFEESERDHLAAEQKVVESQARVAEAQALLDIAVERRRLGVDMPICTSLR